MAARLLILGFFGLLCPALRGQFSTFENDAEGWTTAGDAQNGVAIHVPTFGNPGGSVKGIDAGLGAAWFFDAPPCFLGDVRWAYGQTLEYDLWISDVSATHYADDVVLQSTDGTQLFYSFGANPPAQKWVNRVVPMVESGWRLGSTSGPAPSEIEFKNALADVQFLHIKGEYFNQLDQAFLDNVRLGWLPSTAVKQTICAGDSVVFDSKTFKKAGFFDFSIPKSTGCDSLISLELEVLDSSFLLQKASICAGERFALPDGNSADAPGDYLFRWPKSNGCDSTVLIELAVFPRADTTLDVLLKEGQTFLLPDGTTARDTAFEAVFLLKTANDCDSSVAVRLRTVFIDLFFPNVFSPDDDGLNDVWTPEAGEAVRLFRRLVIFDRWGEAVFDEKDFAPGSRGWDGRLRGKKMDAGVFAFWAEVELFDGSIQKFTGDLTVVR